MIHFHRAALPALGAAFLFGASTPFAKQLMGEGAFGSSPFLLAGLLYLGSGLGLTLVRLLRDTGWKPSGLPRHEWPWLVGAIAFGGVLGPLLLMVGLAHTAAATASLFLNLESVLTAVLAWVVFRESTDRRIVVGMLLIVIGGLVLAWPTGASSESLLGPLALVGACLAWAIDNNLTRKVSASDALFIAGSKGLVAGCVNVGLGFALGAHLPSLALVSSAMVVGFLRLWSESGVVCTGPAWPGHGPHRGLLFYCTVCGCCAVYRPARRAHQRDVLVSGSVDGSRGLVAPDRAPPAYA